MSLVSHLSIRLHHALAREAYAIECGRLGVEPDWDTVDTDTKQLWLEHVRPELELEITTT